MAKKQAPRVRRRGETRQPWLRVLMDWPEGLRLETPTVGKTPNKVSDPVRGGRITVDERALLERLAKKRKEERSVPGTPPSQFALLWRRGLQLRARLRRALQQPEAVLRHGKLKQVIVDAVEAGRVLERLVWRHGGIGGEVVKAFESHVTSIEGLAAANRKREAGLTEGLRHKFDLICSCQPEISRRAGAELLIKESKEDNHRCHHCQRLKWLKADKDDARCERYRLYGRCRVCEDCSLWHEVLSKWQRKRRKKYAKQKLSKDRAKERLIDALARRIRAVDSR